MAPPKKNTNKRIDYQTLKLWPHQKAAIQASIAYLKDDSLTQNFLVKMPTGSGKTGIMAVLSRICFYKKNFLIVVPSIVLKKQLIQQLKASFWSNDRRTILKTGRLLPKSIIGLLPSEVDELYKERTEPVIYVTVVNTLDTLKTDHENTHYRTLKEQIHYIFFDEGHKEPAYSWAKAVRELEKKTILFSATPFRNDLKIFNIDKEHYSFLTHQEAVKKHIIRDIEFRAIKGGNTNLEQTVKTLLTRIKKDRLVLRTDDIDPKVIIRCKNQERIKKVRHELIEQMPRSWNVLAVHDRFDGDGDMRRMVPDEKKMNDYDVILHQNKLIEGVDNPNFLILVIYDGFESERSLIQQLGRVMRNVTQKSTPKAIIYYFEDKEVKSPATVWTDFLLFDSDLETNGIYDTTDLIKIDPRYRYIFLANKIRRITEIDQISLKEFRVPTRTAIRELDKDDKLGMARLADLIIEDLEKEDASIESHRKEDSCHVIVYKLTTLSPYFNANAVIEQQYEVIVLSKREHYIYYFDSRGRLGENILTKTRPLSPDKLLVLNSSARRISSLGAINADLSKGTFNSLTWRANKLEDIAPALNAHNYVATSISVVTRGFVDKKFMNRYTGIKSGKVSEYTENYIGIDQYIQWVGAVHRAVVAKLDIHHYFNRYASKINPPADCKAVNVLLELEDEEDTDFRFKQSAQFVWLDTASEVEDDQFDISLQYGDGQSEIFTVEIKYIAEKQKYELACEELEKAFKSPEGDQTLIGYLNQRQAFRVITTGCQAFYIAGAFYQPRIKLGTQNGDMDILEILVPVKDLATIGSEKGDQEELQATGDNWHKNTLFGLISRMGVGYKDAALLKTYFNLTHLVCDDLGNEMADFIGINEKEKRIVLIHAKAKEATLSASSFHDVCGQVTKNLDILSPFFAKKPEINIDRFDKPWQVTGIGTVTRMRKGKLEGNAFWNLFELLIQHPDTTKEVFVMTGKMLNKAALQEQLKETDISRVKPETINLIYLLRSTWSAVTSMGGKLTIFCYEKQLTD